ncbi:Peptidase A31, hydrogen uptake protein [Candidatus Omnitrophus magneticus]|uniref:Peptidase A31, hydrogen uptake protein n=1 Tax=Candidatus Omnitrophus magneticus TaxID=1609969 RepID=A0A0F0CQI5_9BACT|nr:Peptidase A31, hydrogen uptake protein [Candidatus Omnitrophus magneticus]
MKKILITGIGSILRGDDGIGSRVIDELRKEVLPEGIRLYAGDVSGLDLLKLFPDYDRVIVIDAADMNAPAGMIKVFDSRDIRKAEFSDCLSTHGMTLLQTLTLAEQLELKCEITIVGIQPEDISYRLSVTDTLEQIIPKAVKIIKDFVLTRLV